jgi:glutathione S-transferase
MKLYYHAYSPYARKCRIVSRELSLMIEEIHVDPASEEVRAINPLKKVPVLLLDNGATLFDSPVICEFLNSQARGALFPRDEAEFSPRWHALKIQALADGVMDAATARRQELAVAADRRNVEKLARFDAAIKAALNALECEAFCDSPTIGEVAIGCALGYLEFRAPEFGWQEICPQLAHWFARFDKRDTMMATRPVAPA